MAFDIQSAQPAAPKFDIASATPISEIPGPRRSWGDVSGEAVLSIPSSGIKFMKGMAQAVLHPLDTAQGILDLAAGTLQNITPSSVKNLIDSFDANPEAAKRAVATANAVGGDYAKRYGSVEGFKEALATDPVGVASDLSTLLTGGAALTGKVAPTVSKVLGTAGAYINPAAPITKAAEYGFGMVAKGTGAAIDALQGQRAEVRAGNIIRNALTEEGRTPQNLLAARQALQNAPAGATVRQALADVTSPQIQFLGESVEAQTAPGAKLAERRAQEASRMARLEAVTPDLDAAEAIRSGTAKQLYGISDEALLPGRERQFKTVKVGETPAGVPRIDPMTGQPVMVPVTPADAAQKVAGRSYVTQSTARLDPMTGQPVMAAVTPADVAQKIGGKTTARPIQVEVGRNSFNQPIYEQRVVYDVEPSVISGTTRDTLTNVQKLKPEMTVGGQVVREADLVRTPTRDTLTNTPVLKQDVYAGGTPIVKHVLAGYKYDPELAKLMERPAIQAAFDSAAQIAANRGISLFEQNGQLTGRGAHLVKLAIDDAINPTPGTPIARNTAAALQTAKSQYLSWVEDKVKAYKTARETFKLQSEPVNQAQVLNAMRDVLEQPLGVGERAAAFMTAMGKGEKALLKKATGEARFTELGDVLTPDQLKVVGEVESELRRDANVAQQTKAGAEAMKVILDANKSKFRLPDFMSVKATLANEVLRVMEGKLNKDVMAQLEKAFNSSSSFEDLMQKVPASQRIDVLRALGEAKGKLSPAKFNAYTQAQNALAPSSESQNALAP